MDFTVRGMVMVCELGKMGIADLERGDFFDLRRKLFMQFVGNMAHFYFSSACKSKRAAWDVIALDQARAPPPRKLRFSFGRSFYTSGPHHLVETGASD
eukprot:gene8176-8260_t